MSNYVSGQRDPYGFTFSKRGGRVELWHNIKTGSWKVYLYPHENVEEAWLMHTTTFSERSANIVFYAVNRLTEKDPLVPPPELMHFIPGWSDLGSGLI
jgi:hypothetical protein